MKTLKFFGIASLVVLVAAFTSCSRSNDDSSSELPTNGGGDGGSPKSLTTDELFAKYIGDYSNITCRASLRSGDGKQFISTVFIGPPLYLFGIKNQHLWFSQFDSLGTLKQTWEDTEETDSVLKIDKGYGQYATFHVKSVCPYSSGSSGSGYIAPYFYKKTETGSIIFFGLSGIDENNLQHYIGYAIFTSNNKSKHIRLDYYNLGWAYYDDINEWYNNSLFISYYDNGCCYSETGDTLYVSKKYSGNYVPISYEEGIITDSYYGYWPMKIFRDNLKTGNNVWTTECKAPFDIPTDAKPQYTYTLLDKSTDIWKYKMNMVYYDGTKKEFTFTININTGEYKASV